MILAVIALCALPRQDPGPQVFVAPKRRALVVGASNYEHLGRLRYAGGDAKAVARALTDELGFEPKQVRLLTDDAPDEDLTPTAGHLLGELEALLADPQRNASDLFVFYFSGHGVGLPEGDYLLPVDARRESAARVGLPVREVVERFARSGMRNVLIVVDACREGETSAFGSELFRLADAARLAIVLACEPGARSYEDATLGHGVFTSQLLSALHDPSLRDPASGARWASRVAEAAAAGVRDWSAGRDPPQRPVVWTDPARDVLLDAAIPAAGPEEFFGAAERLDPPAFLAALAAYAGALHAAGRDAECADLLKTSEQIAPLPPEHAFLLASALQQLGRGAEAARVLAEVRAAAPNSLPALVATIADWSGATPAAERAAAARALWDGGASLPLDLIVMMVQAHAQGGAAADALELAEEVLAQTPDGSREEAYLAAIVSMLRPNELDPEQLFDIAEQRAGIFPPLQTIRLDHVLYAQGIRGIAAALPLVDDAIARWPEDGSWLALRAWQRRVAAPSAFDLGPALADAAAALERPLDPGSIWLAARAAGAAAPALADAFQARARAHPLAWQAQLAAVFARQPPDLKAEVERVARLAPRPALVYAAMARLTLDAVIEQAERFLRDPEITAEQRDQVQAQLVAAIRGLFERLVPMAADLGGDPDAWELLQELSQRLLQYEAFVRIFERQFAADIDAGRLPESLVPVYARALLNTGRLERFRAVARSMLRDSMDADSLVWQEALFLACAGRDAEAASVLGARQEPRSRHWEGMGAGLRALAAARAGDADAARALLPRSGPYGPAGAALRALVLRALGEHEEAEALTLQVEDFNAAETFYATVACLNARPGADPRWEASRAAEFQPGNPLVAAQSFLGREDLAAFTGVYAFTIESVSGGMDAAGAELQISILPDGRALGALLTPAGEASVVQGRVDGYGNLEAQLARSGGAITLLAKLAPRALYRDYAHLAEAGQYVAALAPDGLPHLWVARLRE